MWIEREKMKKNIENLEDALRQKDLEITGIKNMSSSKEAQMH